MTGDEFDARAAILAEKRGHDPEDVRPEVAGCRYLELGATLAAAWQDPARWVKDASGLYEVVIVDPVGDALTELELEDRNDDYRTLYKRLIEPLRDAGVAVVLLDNVGHAEDARHRAANTAAKGSPSCTTSDRVGGACRALRSRT